VGQQLAMHAAGMRPLFLDQGSVPEEILDHERNTLRQQVGTLRPWKGKQSHTHVSHVSQQHQLLNGEQQEGRGCTMSRIAENRIYRH